MQVILKQGQGHQTWNNNVDPELVYNQAKFDTSCFNGIWEKSQCNFFLKWQTMSIISLENMWKLKKKKKEKEKKWYIHDFRVVPNNPTKFQYNRTNI